MTTESNQREENNSSSQYQDAELTSVNYPITSAHSNVPIPPGLDEDEKVYETNVQNATEDTTAKRALWRRFIDIISWTPPRCRWNTENPSKFGLPLNILFAFSGTFTVWHGRTLQMLVHRANIVIQVANLYYSHPILDVLAQFFEVSHERVSLIPTCSQAGYATGLILLCPLGDLVRRRHFVLLLTLLTAALWIGLCVTNSFVVFLVLSYFSSVTTVTPVSNLQQACICGNFQSGSKAHHLYSKSCSLLLGISSLQLAGQQRYQLCPRDSSWASSLPAYSQE